MAVFGKKSIFANKWTSVHKQSNQYIWNMKQLSRMKQTAFAVACLLLLCGVADAQTSKKKGAGQRKNIKDFVSFYLDEPEGELIGRVYEVWQKHLKGQRQDEGVTITLDVKNGFFRYLNAYPEENSYTYADMCYWNRKDGKQLLAWNSYIIQKQAPVFTECTFLYFMLYDPATGEWEHMQEEDLGIVFGPKEKGPSVYGFDSKQNSYFIQYTDEEDRIKMTEEEFEEWYRNQPLLVYELPRQGKDLVAKIYEGKKITPLTFRWNGMGFER